jgi:hypothetical protein
LCAGLGAALLAFFVSLYPLAGEGLPLGSDAPVYVWWTRYAAAEGLQALGPGGRAGTVGLVATLAGVTGISAAASTAAIGAVLAATVGLSAGALVAASLGHDRRRFVLAVLFTGTFLSVLVAGYLSTLAFGMFLVATLAVLASDLRRGEAEGPNARSTPLAVGLFAAAGLCHPLFLLLGWVVLAGCVVALLPAWRRDATAGIPWTRRGLTRISGAALGGGLVTIATLPLMFGAVGLETSRDAVLRRLGLGDRVTESYQRKLRDDFSWYRAVVVLGLAALPFVRRRSDRPSPGQRLSLGGTPTDSESLFWGALVAWLVATAVGVVGLLVGVALPGHRLALFCLPLPLLAAMGLARVRDSHGANRGVVALGVLSAAAFLAVNWIQWWDQPTLAPPEAAAQSRVAGDVLGRQSPGTPLILILDPRTSAPGIQVVRATNFVRAGVPASRVPDVHAFVGSLSDFLAGRPTILGREEHDRLSTDAWDSVRPLVSRSPVAVVLEAFDHAGYRTAIELPDVRSAPERFRPGSGVVMVPGFTGRSVTGPPDVGATSTGLTEPGAGPFSPWTPVLLAPLLLALLSLVGAPWVLWSLPPLTGSLARIALAPALGAGAVTLASVVVDAAGLRLGEGGAQVSFALAALGGLATSLMAVRRNRHRRPGVS